MKKSFALNGVLLSWALSTTMILSACNQNLSTGLDNSVVPHTSVINGETVRPGASPNPASKSVVMIELLDAKGGFASLCSASLIGRGKILTAAHCFDPGILKKDFSKFNVVFTTDYFSGGAQVKLPGRYYYKHPQYYQANEGDYPAIPNDIAVASFKGDLPPGYEPAAIETDLHADYSRETLSVYGYGRRIIFTDPLRGATYDTIGVLRKGQVVIEDYFKYRNQYRLDNKSKNPVCSGDSGGPQFYVKDGVVKIVGVTGAASSTLKNGLADCRISGYATKVAPVAKWIQSVMKMR